MKSSAYQRRFYREWVKHKDLHLTRFIERETDLQILTNKRLDREFVRERIRLYRWDIENYINKDRRFFTSLKPLEVELNAPAIVKEMSLQTKKAYVGPMAAVAGAVAEFLGRDLIKRGYREVIVENGGDIFLKILKERTIGIYTDKSRIWRSLKLKIKPRQTPLGICSSSGTIGHSLSFGSADLITIISKNAALADAVATATGNRVKSRQDLQNALDFARNIKGVTGVIIILQNNLISWGEVEFRR
ncbi:MAG: UPF0280 family protein [Candidatus Omnitrophica bacterium]|nr:UPF0280 family protein [Candidatus Omnitrophota bacterium]